MSEGPTFVQCLGPTQILINPGLDFFVTCLLLNIAVKIDIL